MQAVESFLFAIKQLVKRPRYCPQVLVADFCIDTVLLDDQHNSEAGMIPKYPHLGGTEVKVVGKSLITNIGDDLRHVSEDCAKWPVGENAPPTR